MATLHAAVSHRYADVPAITQGEKVYNPFGEKHKLRFAVVVAATSIAALGLSARVSAKSLWERCDQRFCGVTRRAG